MKRFALFLIMGLLYSLHLYSQENGPITVEGEVVCLTCYLKDGVKATGESHIPCAMACYGQGLPQVILDRETGLLYLPINTDVSKRGTDEERFVCSLVEHNPLRDRLTPYLGKMVSITGPSFPGHGVTLISVQKLSESQ